MKQVVIFFLLLCVQLIAGASKGSASYGAPTHATQTFGISEREQIKIPIPVHPYNIIENDSPSVDNDSFFTLEDENEDEDVIGKHLSNLKYLPSLCSAFFSLYGFKPLPQRLNVCNHLSYTCSYKYIVQRALRL